MAECFQLIGLDVVLFDGQFDERVVVGQGVELYARAFEVFDRRLESVGEDGCHPEHFAPGGPECLDRLERASSRGDQVFDHHHFGARFEVSFDLVGHPMILGRRSYVDERFSELFGRQHPAGDRPRRHPGDHLRLRILCRHQCSERPINFAPCLRIGECLAVVAVDRRPPAAGPGERICRAEFYCLNLQQRFCNLFAGFHLVDMKKVYYLDNIVAFGTHPECAALSSSADGSWLVVDTAALGTEAEGMLELTNLQRIFETAKFVAFVSASDEGTERLFARFAEQFRPVEAGRAGRFAARRGVDDLPQRAVGLAQGKTRTGRGDCGVCRARGRGGVRYCGDRVGQTAHTYLPPLRVAGEWILKRTTWYAMSNDGQEELVPQTEEGITEIRWVAPDNLASYLENTYLTVREVFAAAKRL